MDAEEVLARAKEDKVDFVEVWFCDLQGFLKSQAITPRELEHALYEGVGIDGSSIRGYMPIEASDMVAHLDPNTYALLPWRADYVVARLFADIHHPDGSPFEADPRVILKNVLKQCADMGYTAYIGPEVEYFYFKTHNKPEVVDYCGYFDIMPDDEATKLRCRTIEVLEQMGVPVEKAHHEVAPSQHEIDLRYDEALRMADKVVTYRYVVKTVAKQHGVYATFMPKPLEGKNGSGMHTHISLFRNGRNAFFDPNDRYHLSDTGKHFIAGLLKHAPEITLLCNQWVNSYKRLVPGFEAPVYICWAQGNRSVLARVPIYKRGKEQAMRVEFRSPDSACNPYLAFAAIIAAGLEGVKNQHQLPQPFEKDVYTAALSEEELAKYNIRQLPGSLIEAIQLAEKSALVRRVLGEHAFKQLLSIKKEEWNRFRMEVTQFELQEYLPLL
ncbi:MAG: glutamine synthetase [Planctomycetota bacterium]|nr:MAG: glutamine synthetase [Planctomycetota bacterium]